MVMASGNLPPITSAVHAVAPVDDADADLASSPMWQSSWHVFAGSGARMPQPDHALIDRSPAVIYTRDPSAGFAVTSISRNAHDLTGYDAATIVADAALYPSRIHPDDRGRGPLRIPHPPRRSRPRRSRTAWNAR